MRFVVLTLFPGIVQAYAGEGILARAVERGAVQVETVDIRDFTDDRHRTVDDVPFGGGAGMVMKPEPIARAIESVGPVDARVLLTPSGRPFEQADAHRYAKLDSVLFLCGRYEGVDQRIRDDFIDDALSVGDYVLSGGELAALVVLDATMRLLPGVLGNADSLSSESYTDGLLEHPHYTRPAQWRGRPVPEVLLSGHHGRVGEWRRRESLRRTARLRPDLLQKASLTPAEERLLLDLGSSPNREET
ncbi:MAG: tRNA (guanosine(37)-N1)-methyltransferase TrmD [Myxococcales bacterium]|nr:tRNA (guanosine(37)-N1)-methyltransferase TrmD [Myxococcales bacterium]